MYSDSVWKKKKRKLNERFYKKQNEEKGGSVQNFAWVTVYHRHLKDTMAEI